MIRYRIAGFRSLNIAQSASFLARLCLTRWQARNRPRAGLPHAVLSSVSTSHWVGLKNASHSSRTKIQRMASAGHSFRDARSRDKTRTMRLSADGRQLPDRDVDQRRWQHRRGFPKVSEVGTFDAGKPRPPVKLALTPDQAPRRGSTLTVSLRHRYQTRRDPWTMQGAQ